MNQLGLNPPPAGLLQMPAAALERAPASVASVFETQLLQHRRLFAQIDAMRETACAAAVLMAESLRDGGRLLFYGSGASAADAQHLAAEVNSRFCATRPPLPALVLSAERATRAAIAEPGSDQVFARLLLANARRGDCAIALASGGDMASIVRALQTGRALGLTQVALLGGHAPRSQELADLALLVPHADSARVREAHLFIGHTWCQQIEAALELPA